MCGASGVQSLSVSVSALEMLCWTVVRSPVDSTNTPACFRVVIDGVFFTDTQIQLCIYRNCMELFKDYNNTSLPFKRRTIVEKIQRF